MNGRKAGDGRRKINEYRSHEHPISMKNRNCPVIIKNSILAGSKMLFFCSYV